MRIEDNYTKWNYLKYVEFHVVDKCNLNCIACSHFSPMVRKDFDHLPSFTGDIRRLKELFEYITNIRLLGGEPFLEKRLDEYVSVARELYPHSKIEVVTNGLLIPRALRRVLRSIFENKIIVNITLYPPTQKIQKTIEETLNEYGIQHCFSDPVGVFRKKLIPTGESNVDKAFSECTVGKNCTFVYMGRLYLCSGAALVKYYNECAGTDIVFKESSIDLYNTDVTQIMGFLNHSKDSCRYCGRTCTEPWSVCRDLNNINPNHWISDGGPVI